MKSLSIIIPTYNEQNLLGNLCAFLSKCRQKDDRLKEIIVVDAHSTDETHNIISSFGFQIILSNKKSRACQLNLGAHHASGDILYFVHADVIPPNTFIDDIFGAITEGIEFGCFSYRFDHPSRLLKINASFTKKDSSFIGGGDQTLFIKRATFDQLQGFDEGHVLMEDYELYWRAKKKFKHTIVKHDALVSARKYINNSYLRVQLANLIVFNGYKIGVSQQTLKNWYSSMLK